MTVTREVQKPVVILGGAGKTGARVAARLQAQGRPAHILSRSTGTRFDWEDKSTWESAVEGAGALFIVYQPDLAVPGAVDDIRQLTAIALRQGVRRMVLLSGRGEEEAQAAERVLQESGADWTVIRASWFAQNFSETFILDALMTGELALPVADVKEPFIDVDDIADVAAAALTDDKHIGRLYEVTGPRLLTFAEAVTEVAQASGRDFRFRRITPEDYAAGLEAAEVPADFIWLLNYLFTTVLDGRNAHVTDGVRQALGRDARDFADYARDAAATGVWADTREGRS
ncbi:NAD(P)H-binding protein [Hwanghaeella sp.]|uniref:NmrA family NAD(P)-binding protein n=1 Tax=Hwanghaeella sp. TaxID=2605943 RepID=UPI003CCB8C44